LKLARLSFLHLKNIVAPCAGAWIETRRPPWQAQMPDVAPCAGAWIETLPLTGGDVKNRRRPLRGGVD